jgi:membrane protein
LRSAWQEYERDYASYLASSLVYHVLVSLLPLLLVFMGALGLVLRRSELAAAAEMQFLEAVRASFGVSVSVTLGSILQSLEEAPEQRSVIAVVVGFIGLLLTGSELFHHLRMTFRAMWPPLISGPVRRKLRGTLLAKALAFIMMLATSVLLLVTLVLIAALHWVSATLGSVPLLSQPVTWLLALPGPLIFAPLTFALLFRFLPPIRLAWRHVWLASALCAIAWILGAEILALYGAYLGKDLGPYGSIGELLIIMLWINFVSQILFFGAELCKVLASRAPPAVSQ